MTLALSRAQQGVPAARWTPVEDKAQRVVEMSRDVYPARGLIVSPEIDRAFERVKRALPDIVIHEWATGTAAEDWVVPPSWQAVEGVLVDSDGKLIASLDESFLFVAPYSEPVDGWFAKEEIAHHCRTRPDMPEAYSLEHRNAYDFRLDDWGITLPHARWAKMRDGERYHVTIRTRVQPGMLRVAELTIPGERPEIISICSQFDELCNDGQSSGFMALELFRDLMSRPKRTYSYQVLLVPEMVGTLFYAHFNRERVRQTVAMLNLETLGAGERWVIKKAFRGGTRLDNALQSALRQCGIDFAEAGFFDAYGNDERVYGWPTLGVPGVALQRFPFRQYHTHFDTPDLLDPVLLGEAARVCQTCIDELEDDYVPEYMNYLQPWLTKHGLYFDFNTQPDIARKLSGVVLYSIDGRTSISELARAADLPFRVVWEYLERFVDKGLIRRQPMPPGVLRE